MKARKSAAKGKRIKVTKGKAPFKKTARRLTQGFGSPRRAHTMTAYEACLQHNANLRYALMQIRDLEPVLSPGMSAVQGQSLKVAQEIARAALELK